LEPTQVAGFSQFYDDFNGSEAKLYGVGIDVRLKSGVYTGMEALRRNVASYGISRSVELFGTLNNEGLVRYTDDLRTTSHEEKLVNTYIYWAPDVNWAVGAEYRFEKITTSGNRQVNTMSAPVGVRYFHHGGSFAALTTTFVRQEVETMVSDRLDNQTEAFSVIDAGVGYRFPNRGGLVSLEVRNLLNKRFNFQDLGFISGQPDLPLANQRFVPARTFLGRLTINF
jgi:hypothetical protein